MYSSFSSIKYIAKNTESNPHLPVVEKLPAKLEKTCEFLIDYENLMLFLH